MKFLVNPLAILLIAQLFFIVILWVKRRDQNSVFIALLAPVLLLIVLSLPITSLAFSDALKINQVSSHDEFPTHLFVLGGGYEPGQVRTEDLLVFESQKRVIHAVSLWKKNRSSILVFSGAVSHPNRSPARLADLMSQMAVMYGVPETSILVEPNSLNTREHPIEALKLSGVNLHSQIGIITSEWHIRRALTEFNRHFHSVTPYPVPMSVNDFSVMDLIPKSESLAHVTTLLREIVGMIWYDIKNRTISL